MFPGLDPKKMQGIMKKMGIAQQEIPANRVIIEKDDGNIVINDPSVIKINMQGQTNFQVSGDVSEEANSREDTSEKPLGVLDEDVATVVEKTGCKPEQAKAELEKTDDIAEAIINLSK